MEAGQGNIDINLKKSPIKKISNFDTPTNSPGIHIINIAPDIKWEKKPLPTKVPDGAHGGIVIKKFEFKTKNRNNVEVTFQNLEIYVPDIGFGAGGLVVSGAGPVLLGGGSMGLLTHICLPWIAIILLVTALIWTVRWMLQQRSMRRRPRHYATEMKSDSRNWIREVMDKDQQSISRNPSLLNGNALLLQTQAIVERSSQGMSDTMAMAHVAPSNFSGSIVNSLLKSRKNSTMKGTSTASILSEFSALMASTIYEVPTWHTIQSISRTNQIAVCQEKDVIFTVSESNCPNAYSSKNITGLELCAPSKYNECAEVILLSHETILVGKMKTGSEYFVQAWSTNTGEMGIGALTPIPCLCVCKIRDEYLVALSATDLLVLHPDSSTCVAQTQSPVANNSTDSRTVTMQPTKDGNYIVISAVTGYNLSLYVIMFDDLRNGGSHVSIKEYHASSFTLISSSEIIIALTSFAIISWNFARNIEISVLDNSNQEIHGLISSLSQELFLIQLTKHMSIFRTSSFLRIFDVPVSINQVCAMAFSPQVNGNTLLIIALDSGTIEVRDCSDGGQVIHTVQVDTPVTCLLVDDARQMLLTVSDPASHYLLKVFPLP